MANVFPFSALLPDPGNAEAVCAPPYDVVTVEEARELAKDKPLSFLRVSRPDLELPETIPPNSDAVFERALENFNRLKREVPFRRDPAPAYYIYTLETDGRRQTGIVATPAVDDYEHGDIKRHETTKPDKVEDRARHIRTLRAQTGPVFLVFRDAPDLVELMDEVRKAAPMLDVQASDGVRHLLWRVPGAVTGAFRAAFAQIPALYIADGHHRAESARRVRDLLREKDPALPGDAPCNRFLAVIFPASALHILPYNRVILDLGALTPESFLEALRTGAGDLRAVASGAPPEAGWVHVYVSGRWYALDLRNVGATDDPVARLDAARLQNTVLAPILGVRDPRTDPRIDFVGGLDSVARIQEMVDIGAAKVAFSLYPVRMEQVMAIADAGRILPPKSTWFHPKLADGLFIHEI